MNSRILCLWGRSGEEGMVMSLQLGSSGVGCRDALRWHWCWGRENGGGVHGSREAAGGEMATAL